MKECYMLSFLNFKYTALLLLLVMRAYAAVTYVDATLDNTTINGKKPQEGVTYIDDGMNDDDSNGLWGIRLREGVNGGFLWNCDKVNEEETEPLITSMEIEGEPGEYYIYGFFLNSRNGDNNWDCSFSIDGGKSYSFFTKDNTSRAVASDFNSSVSVIDKAHDCRMHIACIGKIKVTEPRQQVDVYVQGQTRGFFSGKIWMDDRTWYEGVGYSKEPPRPLENNVTLNRKFDGYRGIWYMVGPTKDEYAYKYSGGLGTYCAKHRPFAVYSPEVNKTFFCYGGAREGDNRSLVHMVSYYDHSTGMVPRPTLLLDKKTSDAHDNPVISMDDNGYIWIFSTSHGTSGSSYIHKSSKPYSIESFELVRPVIQIGEKKLPFANFSYFQCWFSPEKGFECFMTLYHQPVTRTIYYLNSKDGVNWNKPVCLSKMGHGSYQTSFGQNGKVATAFNYHPDEGGISKRTNIYYMESTDGGISWVAAGGKSLELPLGTPINDALVKEYESKSRNVYVKDLRFDDEGKPVILYLTSGGWQAGPQNNPRSWTIARWDGQQWQINEMFVSDNNYDSGTLSIENDKWTVVCPSAVGPQAYNPGGEMVMWESVNKGKTWNQLKQLTVNSPRNHGYARRPLNLNPDFYAVWADGHGRKPSLSNLYFCDKDGNVYMLPREMKNNFEKPVKVELGKIK